MRPCEPTAARPEFPGLIRGVGLNRSFYLPAIQARIGRCKPLITPVSKVRSSPKGFPMAAPFVPRQLVRVAHRHDSQSFLRRFQPNFSEPPGQYRDRDRQLWLDSFSRFPKLTVSFSASAMT